MERITASTDRFWDKAIEQESGCWEWVSTKNRDGYGVYGVRHGVMRLAHRLAYESLVIDIPAGLQLDHLCRNRGCVNPWHLDPVTPRVNWLRGHSMSADNLAKTHCPRGHAFEGENVRVERNGSRRCKACAREYQRRLRAARRRVREVYGDSYQEPKEQAA